VTNPKWLSQIEKNEKLREHFKGMEDNDHRETEIEQEKQQIDHDAEAYEELECVLTKAHQPASKDLTALQDGGW